MSHVEPTFQKQGKDGDEKLKINFDFIMQNTTYIHT